MAPDARGPRGGPASRTRLAWLGLLALAGCSSVSGAESLCVQEDSLRPLPIPLAESSGIAPGSDPDVFWSVNDSGNEARLWAVDGRGGLLGSVRVPGVDNRDWEDLASAPCGDGTCLWVADTGDNEEVRERVALLRIPEPSVEAETSAEPDRFPVRFPDGPRDVEALAVFPDGEILLVSKGRSHPVTVYRYPLPLRVGTVVTVEEVQRLSENTPSLREWVTGAAAAPSGEVVAVRTFQRLTFYRRTVQGLQALDSGTVNLVPLREPQGESVGIGDDGLVVLTSEAGPAGGRAAIALLRCRIPPD